MSQTDTETADNGDIESYLDQGAPKKWYKRKRWWALALLILLVLFGISQCSGGEQKPDYITSEVETRSLDLSVTATGSLRPTNQVEVGSEVSGRIDRVLVDVNDQVSRGQLLAVINTEVIQDQIQQGRANLNAARAQVAQAQATLEGDEAQLNRLLEVQHMAAIENDKSRWQLAGDQFYVDFNLSEENTPAGTRLQIGTAVIEVTEEPHLACGKFAQRFGKDAARFVNSTRGKKLNLRGINAKVILPGVVDTGACITKL